MLLAVGEAYVVDLRKEHRGRVELYEEDLDEESQTSRPRYAEVTMIPLQWCLTIY